MPVPTFRIDLDIKKPKGSVTPEDIARVLGQSKHLSGSLAKNAAKSALSGMNSIKAIKSVAGAVAGGIKGLGLISTMISALSTALTVAKEAEKFLKSFREGPFKYKKYLWDAQWGIVLIQIAYNCRTGQYIVRIQGRFNDPRKYKQRAGGSGREGVSPDRAGSFDIIIYGNV